MFPSLFLSHGAPTLPLGDTPAKRFLSGLGDRLGKPDAILVASAHWETARPTISAVAVNATIHDFYGFPPALYAMRYPAPGAPALAERVSDLLCAAGLASALDHSRGLDHGAWIPLSLIYPAADIPVVQISLQHGLGPAHHFEIGRALAELRRENVLLVGSGSFTHDLARLTPGALDETAPADVTAFADWMDHALAQGRSCDLLTYRNCAPYAAKNHPSEEHLMPLFVALGAAGAKPRVELLHQSTSYSVLRMDAYAFRETAAGSPAAST